MRPAERRILTNGEPAQLGGRAFDLLLVLIEHRDRVVGKDELMARVWPGVAVEENNLTVQISSLRKVLGNEAIATVAGRGYRFNTAFAGRATAGASALPARGSASQDLPVIAVLAFDNLSNDAEMQFFSDGVSEEIIHRLSRGANLKVIARTSSFQFRGERKGEAAERLKCAYVLDGTIQRAAGRVRISAQLMEASSRTALWSDRYDRQSRGHLRRPGRDLSEYRQRASPDILQLFDAVGRSGRSTTSTFARAPNPTRRTSCARASACSRW